MVGTLLQKLPSGLIRFLLAAISKSIETNLRFYPCSRNSAETYSIKRSIPHHPSITISLAVPPTHFQPT